MAEISDISNGTRNPNTLLNAMKHIMKTTYQILHSLYAIDLLKSLVSRGIGTESVEKQCRKLPGEQSLAKTLVTMVMKNRIKHAYKVWRKNRYENTQAWRAENNILH